MLLCFDAFFLLIYQPDRAHSLTCKVQVYHEDQQPPQTGFWWTTGTEPHLSRVKSLRGCGYLTNSSGVPCRQSYKMFSDESTVYHRVLFSINCVLYTWLPISAAVWIKGPAESLNIVRLCWFGQCVVASESGASGTYGFTYEPPPSLASSPLSAHLFPSPPCLLV